MPSPVLTRRALHPRQTLLRGLRGFWPLGEPSGSRADAHSNFLLTDNNTVTQGDGLIGKAAVFVESNSEYLSVPDHPFLAGGSEMTVTAWVNLASTPGSYYALVSKAGASSEWLLSCYDSPNVVWSFEAVDTLSSFVAAEITGSGVNAGVWAFLVGAVGAGQLILRLNDNQNASSTFSNPVRTTSDPFTIGADGIASGASNASIQNVGFWQRRLTPPEITWLYNAGRGRAYPFI